MRCFGDLCLRVERVVFKEPPSRIEIRGEGAVVICVKRGAVASWIQLAQALFYAFHWRVARNPNIGALVFLSQKSQIRDALAASAVGEAEAICAAFGPRDALERLKMPRGEPYWPEGEWDPWLITKFALELAER